MDKLFIQGLELSVIVGVYPHERTCPQTILVDLELSIDINQASASDSLAQTIDYDRLIDQVKLYTKDTKFLLIETLAEHIAQFILHEFNIHWLRLCLTKPGAVQQLRSEGTRLFPDKISPALCKEARAATKGEQCAPLWNPKRAESRASPRDSGFKSTQKIGVIIERTIA